MGTKQDFGILKNTFGDGGTTSIGKGNALNTKIGVNVLEVDIVSTLSKLPLIKNLAEIKGIQDVFSSPIGEKSQIKAGGLLDDIGINKNVESIIKLK